MLFGAKGTLVALLNGVDTLIKSGTSKREVMTGEGRIKKEVNGNERVEKERAS